ncbi:MAG: glycosyltransferase involved in cell wall biosynthesis [Patiriisocius sp.]|jgi:glycosyltransferase involved in cell wall biosynthesis
MRILLLSPYDAMSHQYWHQRLIADLTALSLIEGSVEGSTEIVLVTLPPRFFSWRFRGNSLTLSQHKRVAGQKFDLVIATSMTDLSALIGMAPNLAGTPSALYFHENQFAYPDPNQSYQVERQITSIYSALAASALIFNSNFNLNSFLEGTARLLAKLPDGVPADIESQLRQKARVISVPIDTPDPLAQGTSLTQGLVLVWNHRWEYDKGLDELIVLLNLVKQKIPAFKCHVIGQSFRSIPAQMETVRNLLGDSLGEFGFVPTREAYLTLLSNSDIVLSTARQEFQGIAVLEAIAAGCTPVVPDSLAYQEFVPENNRYKTPEAALRMISLYDKKIPKLSKLPPQLSPSRVRDQWRQLLDELLQ